MCDNAKTSTTQTYKEMMVILMINTYLRYLVFES